MAGSKLLAARAPPLPRAAVSRSSRNLRNMIQVSSGRRSRSPLSPLSLRMMSRADLIRLPKRLRGRHRRIAVRSVFLITSGIEHSSEVRLRRAKLFGTAEQPDDFARTCHDSRSAEHAARPAARIARRRARHIFRAARRESDAPRGCSARRNPCAPASSCCARSRRVRSGALKARWQSRSKGSASGCFGCSASSSKLTPRSASAWMISVRCSASAQRSRNSGAVGQSVRTVSAA